MCTNAGPRDGKFISAPRVPGVDLVLLAFDLVRIATLPSAAESARREFKFGGAARQPGIGVMGSSVSAPGRVEAGHVLREGEAVPDTI